MTVKVCKSCLRELSVSMFYLNYGKPEARCKRCKSADVKKRREGELSSYRAALALEPKHPDDRDYDWDAILWRGL